VKVKQALRKVTIVTTLQMRGITIWVKEDKMPNSGPFIGNLGVKQIPSNPTKVSEIIELFFGDNFFEMLTQGDQSVSFSKSRKIL
jgi:hypothetical protein